MNHALRAGGAAAGISVLITFGAFAGAGAQDAHGCSRPNVPASMIHPAGPDASDMAVRQGVTGTVHVVVSLGADSRVAGTRIQSSPNALLNSAALTAARRSTFQTEIRNCAPIAVISAVGIASRPPDVASVSAGILTNDDVASVAAAKNDALEDAAGQAQAVAAASRMHVAGIRQIQVGQNLLGPPMPAPNSPPIDVNRAAAMSLGNLRPLPVEVRANVTVTYVLKP